MQLAYQKMLDFNKNFKDTKRVYQEMQTLYLHYKFKDGVFCPSSELYPIAPIFLVERERGGLGNKIVNHMDERQISLLTYFWGLHTFGTWRNTLGVYRLDADIFKDVVRSPIPSDTPSTIFQRLPEWCVYMDMPKDTVSIVSEHNSSCSCDGFWALLDYDIAPDTEKRRLVLNIVLNPSNKTHTVYDAYQPMRILIEDGLTVSEAFEQLFIQDFSHDDMRHAIQAKKDMGNTRKLLMSLLSALLWLCAEEPDISNIQGEPLSREDIKKMGYQVNKKTGRFVPPSTPVIRELGKRLGGEIRVFKQKISDDKDDISGGDESKKITRRVRPHIRSGHFHGYWKGSGQNKVFDVKWLPAIFVNSSI